MKSRKADEFIGRLRDKKYPFEVEVLGFKIKVLETVYPPGSISKFFAEVLENNSCIKSGDRVLDYGCGCGCETLIAARMGASEIVGLDINPKSVQCTKENLEKNGFTQFDDIRVGNSFDPVKKDEIFDVIIASLSWEDSKPMDIFEYTFYDEDFKFRKTLFKEAKKHLSEEGRIYFTYSKSAQEKNPIESFCPEYDVKIIAEKLIRDEPHYILEIKLKK